MAGSYPANTIFENLGNAEKRPPVVIQLFGDYTELLLRITGRRLCPTCGRLYNIHFQPSFVDELCDFDFVLKNAGSAAP